jgi:hypothetical protein
MKSMYSALDTLMIDPSVLNVAATSGTADKTVVEETGARKLQNDIAATMTIFLRSEKRLYTSSKSPVTTGFA